MKVAFVILHYLTEVDTVECIESILKNVEYNDYQVVVVDNGSQNGSGLKLKSRYKDFEKIQVILSKDNLGFAKGNNLGYTYAKENLDADFIVMINNDTIIEQKDFLKLLVEHYNSYKFDILGPDIVSLIDHKHQNPHSNVKFNITNEYLKKNIMKNKLFLILSYLRLDKIIRKLYKVLLNKNAQQAKTSIQQQTYDVKLHGSCWIFSPNYIKKFKGIYSKTFLYQEEDILYYIAQKEKLKLVYDPKLKIFHKEDSSTDELTGSSIKKRRFVYTHEINSLKAFKELVEDNTLYKKDLMD